MPIAVTRRELFGRSAAKSAALLPPWAISISDYSGLCDGCGECVSACPEQILSLNEDHLAIVDFKKSGCILCGDCETACPTGALKKENAPAWNHKAVINSKCISTQGVVCRLCEEACDAQAIKFKLLLEGRSMPLITSELCNGCGGCLSVCPTDAVSLITPNNEEPQ